MYTFSYHLAESNSLRSPCTCCQWKL